MRKGRVFCKLPGKDMTLIAASRSWKKSERLYFTSEKLACALSWLRRWVHGWYNLTLHQHSCARLIVGTCRLVLSWWVSLHYGQNIVFFSASIVVSIFPLSKEFPGRETSILTKWSLAHKSLFHNEFISVRCQGIWLCLSQLTHPAKSLPFTISSPFMCSELATSAPQPGMLWHPAPLQSFLLPQFLCILWWFF